VMLMIVGTKTRKAGAETDATAEPTARATTTVAGPEETAPGTVPVIVVSFQTEMGATMPLNFTVVLAPLYAPKLTPEIVNGDPMGAEDGVMEAICEAETLKEDALLNSEYPPCRRSTESE
jgi:hypothetical protein